MEVGDSSAVEAVVVMAVVIAIADLREALHTAHRAAEVLTVARDRRFAAAADQAGDTDQASAAIDSKCVKLLVWTNRRYSGKLMN